MKRLVTLTRMTGLVPTRLMLVVLLASGLVTVALAGDNASEARRTVVGGQLVSVDSVETAGSDRRPVRPMVVGEGNAGPNRPTRPSLPPPAITTDLRPTRPDIVPLPPASSQAPTQTRINLSAPSEVAPVIKSTQ